jgi:hypothetical protein
MGDREDLKKALQEVMGEGEEISDELLDEFSDGKGDEDDE